jgi:hypothetical protein
MAVPINAFALNRHVCQSISTQPYLGYKSIFFACFSEKVNYVGLKLVYQKNINDHSFYLPKNNVHNNLYHHES